MHSTRPVSSMDIINHFKTAVFIHVAVKLKVSLIMGCYPRNPFHFMLCGKTDGWIESEIRFYPFMVTL